MEYVILWTLFGVGITTGFAIKEGVFKRTNITDSDPADSTKLKRFLKILFTYLIVYLCLNLIVLIPVAFGLWKEYTDYRDIIILINLIIAGAITFYLVKYKLKNHFK